MDYRKFAIRAQRLSKNVSNIEYLYPDMKPDVRINRVKFHIFLYFKLSVLWSLISSKEPPSQKSFWNHRNFAQNTAGIFIRFFIFYKMLRHFCFLNIHSITENFLIFFNDFVFCKVFLYLQLVMFTRHSSGITTFFIIIIIINLFFLCT